MGYDIIGDIHGHVLKLEALLNELGYVRRASSWVPPRGRQAIFLGDLIDRGPAQVEVVNTVRSMIDAGYARSVLGNHELNAIGYATRSPGPDGGFLRPHSEKNLRQHEAFLAQVGEGSALHHELVTWFKTLPPTLDLGEVRVVHAWWHQPHVDVVERALASDGSMGDAFVAAAYDATSPVKIAMDGLTKGLEIPLPEGHEYVDNTGMKRGEVRTRWWHEAPRSFRDVAMVGDREQTQVPDHPLPGDYLGGPVEGAPVFVGHYWLTGQPGVLTPKVCCVDFSAAKEGPLVAYRWDGEQELDDRRFVWAG